MVSPYKRHVPARLSPQEYIGVYKWLKAMLVRAARSHTIILIVPHPLLCGPTSFKHSSLDLNITWHLWDVHGTGFAFHSSIKYTVILSIENTVQLIHCSFKFRFTFWALYLIFGEGNSCIWDSKPRKYTKVMDSWIPLRAHKETRTPLKKPIMA